MLTEKGLRRQIRMHRVDLSEKLFKLNPNNRINLMRYGVDLAAMGKLIWADSDEENTINDKVRGYDAADGFFSKAVAHSEGTCRNITVIMNSFVGMLFVWRITVVSLLINRISAGRGA